MPRKRTYTDEVQQYIKRAYYGYTPARCVSSASPSRITNTRLRVFRWYDNAGRSVYGNTQAFAEHLSRWFNLPLTADTVNKINKVLRRQGVLVRPGRIGRDAGRKHPSTLQQPRVARSIVELVTITERELSA